MCGLNVLGLEERPAGDQHVVYSERDCGKLEIHPSLTIARLSNLMKKLQKVPSHLDEYDEIIQNQLKQGIVERVSDETQEERECHLLHKAVIREAAQNGYCL